MNKKLQVFVSSTYTDLIEERQAAVEAILSAGHIPAGMELFKAGKSQMKTIQKWIDESDVYMLILGGRYGSIEDESNLSYTELEYRYAISKNMPVFAIVLDDSFLFTKAAVKGKDVIFEEKNTDKYEFFKKYVKDNLVKFVKNVDQISSAIHEHINNILKDSDYNLVGWIKSDTAILDTDEKTYSNSQLHSINDNIFNELITRYYPIHPNDLLEKFCNIQNNLLKYGGWLESYKRVTNLYLIDSNSLKVKTTTKYNYGYLPDELKHYGKYFFATKEQAESFKMEDLLINDIDFTKQFDVQIEKRQHRGQFPYIVKSKKSLPIESIPAIIYESSSYICPPLDFIQKAEPPFPCKNFDVTIQLHNDTENQYSIIGMVFSQFNKDHADDYSSSQMRNRNSCYTMQLPEWSLPGSGYMAILKRNN